MESALHYLLISLITLILILLLKQKPSIWFDEYFWGIAYQDAPNLTTFLQLVGTQGPEVAPLYLSIMYTAIKLFHLSPEIFRYFSFIASIATILFIYKLFKIFFPPFISFIMSLISAIIPTFLWYSMLLRPHALAFCLSMCSLYLFFSTIKSKTDTSQFKQLLLLTIVNGLLILTYYIYVWLVFFETVIFFFIFLVEKSKKIFWVLPFHLLYVIVILLYLTLFSTPSNIAYSIQISLDSLFNYIFGVQDREVPHYFFISPWIFTIFGTNKVSSIIANLLEIGIPFLFKSTHIVFMLILFYFFVKGFLSVLKSKSFRFEIPNIALLCIAFIVPFCFVVFTLITKIPLMTIRFLLPSLIIRWGLLSKIIFDWTPRRSFFKVFGVSFFIVYIFLQYLMYQQSKPYTAWDECTNTLAQEISEKDVIILGPGDIVPIFHYHWCSRLKHSTPIMAVSGSLYLTTDLLIYLIKHLPSERNIWVLFRSEFGTMPPLIRKEWEEHHLVYHTVKEFPSFEGLIYFGFSIKENLENTVSMDSINTNSSLLETSKELAPHLKSCLETNSNPLDLSILSRYDNPLETPERGTYVQYTMDWLSINRHCWAQTLLEPISNISPWVEFSYALSCLDTDPTKAEKIFHGIKRSSIFFYNTMCPIWNAIKAKDYDTLDKETKKLMDYGLWIAHYFNHFAKHKLVGSPCILHIGSFPYNWDIEIELQKTMSKEPQPTNNEFIETRYKQIIDIMNFQVKP